MTSGWSEILLPALCLRRWTGAIHLACLLAWSISACAQEQTKAQASTIRVDVSRVNVGVIVTDSRGKFVEGLQPSDFQILDNGAPQPVSDFASVDSPAQVMLLMEAGPAVYLLQDSHLFVADSLLNGLSASDRMALAVYNDAPTALLDYTADKRAFGAALDRIQFNLGYGSLNLAKSLNTVLDWLSQVPGKKSIVLLSSGVDTSPLTAAQELLGRLQTGDVRILAISTSGPLRNGKKGTKNQIQQAQQAFAEADVWLKTLAEATGGRAYFPENAKALQESYRQIAELVRHEYSLAFVPPVADGAMHAIEVNIRTAQPSDKNSILDYRVDHRRGYRAPQATP